MPARPRRLDLLIAEGDSKRASRAFVPRLPAVLTVTVAGYQLPVVPLTVLLETNADVADLRRRSAVIARQSME
ncbi:hypothetical protein FB565_001103 [Actinoplanes lutulentus]|uniref:hypothetical protein n=1 Tax=Actinoplanes lutulentus TaxID=1287878 RepID=UPI000DBAA06B|nr:hypothetical protein [Actinoplanes lutulentus]MBB2941399.1 hypothetical protein [Actinoplanes lutulentus]